MLSKLKRRAASGDNSELLRYEALNTFAAKRAFYYDSWIATNPNTTTRSATRTRASENQTGTQGTDHGYQDRDFIASQLGYKEWRTIPEQQLKLEAKLSTLPKKRHPAADVLLLTNGFQCTPSSQEQWWTSSQRT